MTQTISEPLLRQLSRLCADRLGLSFPPERWSDLERGILSAASEISLNDPEYLVKRLLYPPQERKQLEALASHLTVGETYFYRDKGAFEALEAHILPQLISTRTKSEKRLRIWSAGCSTGEEAYSIAIAVRRSIPDIEDWNVTILATDINPRFLNKAARAQYGEWSFRDTHSWLRERYFTRTGDGRYQLLPDIKEMVSFAYLNLAEDAYPSLLNNTNAMDLIFCRNVLMYLVPERARRVVENLYHTLVEGGWIFVSPSEASHILFERFAAVTVKGTILYRKDGTKSQTAINHLTQKTPLFAPDDGAREMSSIPSTTTGIRAGAGAADRAPPAGETPESVTHLARAYANQGILAEALACCEKAIAGDKLNPGLHYLRSTILQEQGLIDQAIDSLKRALYLDQNFALAHFSLGNLAQKSGKLKEAARYFENTLSILEAYAPEEIVPESEGITAARLREIVESTIEGVERS